MPFTGLLCAVTDLADAGSQPCTVTFCGCSADARTEKLCNSVPEAAVSQLSVGVVPCCEPMAWNCSWPAGFTHQSKPTRSHISHRNPKSESAWMMYSCTTLVDEMLAETP